MAPAILSYNIYILYFYYYGSILPIDFHHSLILQKADDKENQIQF